MTMKNSHRSSVPKMERKVIEKNRRNLMKGLYSQLHSLLPSHASNCKVYPPDASLPRNLKTMEQMPLPDQIDEAVKYIKSLQMKVEKCKEKKKYLLCRKRPYSCIESDDHNIPSQMSTTSSPKIEIHEMGASMDVILVSGLDSIATFIDIICLLQQEGVDIVNASFSISGNSVLQIVHEKIEKSTFDLRATSTLSRKLKELVCGASSSDMESQLDFLEHFEIEPSLFPSLWDFELGEIRQLGMV